MKRTQVELVIFLLVLALAAMTFAGVASAGWTWDDGASSSPSDSATVSSP